jgi:hypothetical protein
MDKNERKTLYKVSYTIRKDQILDFVNQLHDMQQEYIEAAVEASKFKEANEVINHIKSLKEAK